jgi:oxygen-dependent protoporphyrinogen oxidase
MQIKELGLDRQVMLIPKTSPAAQNRFLAIRNQLVKLPHSVGGLLKASIRYGDEGHLTRQLITAVLKEPFNRNVEEALRQDESVNEFISRRFSPYVSNYLVSAVLHGIYAGSTHSLSAPSVLASLYELERKYGSILKGMVFESLFSGKEEHLASQDSFVSQVQRGCTMYTFRNGMETLTKGILDRISKNPNVEVRKTSSCLSIAPTTQGLKVQNDLMMNFSQPNARSKLRNKKPAERTTSKARQ